MKRFFLLGCGLVPLVAQSAPDPAEHEWRFEGSMGDKLPITLLLREVHEGESGSHLEGSYFYHRTGLPIELSITEPEYQQLVCEEIAGYDAEGESRITGVLDLRWSDDRDALTGEWRSPDGQKKLPVMLKETYAEGSVKVAVHTMESTWSESRGGATAGQSKAVSFLQLPPANSALMAINQHLLKHAWLEPGFWIGSDETLPESEEPPAKLTVEEVLSRHRVRAPDEIEWDDFPFMETAEDRMRVEMNGDGFLTVCHDSYGYSGGAHGMYGSGYEVFDLSTGAVLELTDIAKPGTESKWLELGKEALLKQAGLPPTATLDEVGVWEDSFVELTDNWFLVPGGIGFCYNPYEVASYARGQVTFTLPWSEIREDLLPNSPVAVLVAKFGGK